MRIVQWWGPLATIWRAVLIVAALGLTGAGAWSAGRSPASEAELQTACKEQSAADSARFNACVDEGRAGLSRRRAECIAIMREWSLPSSAQATVYRDCIAAESIDEYRRETQQRLGGEGVNKRTPLQITPGQFARWVGYNGPVTINIVAAHSIMWTGQVESGVPIGRGKIAVRMDYLVDRTFSGPLRKSGELIVQGELRSGSLDGRVELLAHPEFQPRSLLPVENDFAQGVNRGLPLSQACASALPVLHPGTSVEWMGSCRGAAPHAGLAVFWQQGQRFDIACFSGGRFADRDEIRGFAACADHWQFLPRYCKAGDYNGQCLAGVPQGVGVRVWNEAAGTVDAGRGLDAAVLAVGQAMSPGIRNHFIRRGQFADGKLSGYGYSGRADSCGMAGCSGPTTTQVGWFESDRLALACANFGDCLARTSGAAFTAQVADDPATTSQVAQLRKTNDFRSVLQAFALTKDMEDLRRASRLAATREERAEVEHSLFRVSGYDKIVAVDARLESDAGHEVALDESEKLLGFVRDTRADLPLNVRWRISTQGSRVPLRHGSYRVRVVMGINATTNVQTCLGICRNERREESVHRTIEVVLRPTEQSASGVFDLRKTAASAGAFLGVSTVENLLSVAPYVRVETMELIE